MGKLIHDERAEFLIPTQAFIIVNTTQMMQNKVISVSVTSIINYLID